MRSSSDELFLAATAAAATMAVIAVHTEGESSTGSFIKNHADKLLV